MRKLILLAAVFLISIVTGFAQNVKNFDVGPYEVDYKGDGDIKYRLRKGIDLYKYFGLKKDTVVLAAQSSYPVKGAFQLSASLAAHSYTGGSMILGLEGSWKQKIGGMLYFNSGLSLGVSLGKYGGRNNLKETMLLVGVPLSIEISKIDRKEASLFAAVGVTPVYYNTMKSEYPDSNIPDPKKNSGVYVAPKLEVGGYIPVEKCLVRLGFFGQYNINCTKNEIGAQTDANVFKDYMGCAFFGGSVGIIF
ncbi:hypothetical protein [Phocaeicola sp.]